MTDQSQDKLVSRPLIDSEALIGLLALLSIFCAMRARDAWQALMASDLQQSLTLFFFEPSLLYRIAPALIIPIIGTCYLVWVKRAVHNMAADQDDTIAATTIRTVTEHILPPFFLYAPSQTMRRLVRHAVPNSPPAKRWGDMLTSLWWGMLWLALIIEIIKRTILWSNDMPTSQVFFVATIFQCITTIIASASLIWLTHTITKANHARLGLTATSRKDAINQ